LNDENFLKFTKMLKDYPLAQPLVEFLKKDENTESVQKILKLLKEIWSQDTIDMQIKTLVLNLLTQYVQEDNAKQHIDNIWVLWEFLQKNEELNIDTIIKVLENSSQVQELVGQINTFSHEPDIIKDALKKPELITYIHAFNQSFPNRPATEKAKSLRQFFQDSTNPISTCALFLNLDKLDEEEQNKRMRLLDSIMSHAQSKKISQLILEIQTLKPTFFTDVQKTTPIVNLFQETMDEKLELSLIADVVIKLDEHQCLDLMQTEHLGQLKLIHDLMEAYSKRPTVDKEKDISNIKKILQVKATTWSEQEQNIFLKSLQTEPPQPQENITKKKKTSFIPNASSVFQPFIPKKNSSTSQEIKKNEETKPALPGKADHKQQYRLFKKQKKANDVENQLTLG
ncbi:MAG: hypothetical protein QG556_657, partial [Pseudomonadota bacterium]|nr:hypothetical protein [Pseudomonadota bacterium]